MLRRESGRGLKKAQRAAQAAMELRSRTDGEHLRRPSSADWTHLVLCTPVEAGQKLDGDRRDLRMRNYPGQGIARSVANLSVCHCQ